MSGLGPGQPEEVGSGGGGAGGPAGSAGPSAGTGHSGFGGLLQALSGAPQPEGDGAHPDAGGTPPDAATALATMAAAVLAAAMAALAAAQAPTATAAQGGATANGTSVAPQAGGGPQIAGTNTAATVGTAASGAVGAGSAVPAGPAQAEAAKAAVQDVGTAATATATTAAIVAQLEGKEPGARETHGGVVDAGSRRPGRDETGEVPRTGSGGPSAPSSFPSSNEVVSVAPVKHAAGGPTADGTNGDPQAGNHAPSDAMPERPAPSAASHDASTSPRSTPAPAAAPAATRASVGATTTTAVAAVEPRAHAMPAAQPDVRTSSDTPVPPAPPHTTRTADAPPPAPSPPSAAVDVERLLSLSRARPMARDDGGEMRIHVRPEGLGQVEARVVVQGDGVQASLLAHDDHARQQLEQHKSSLAAMLGRQNLRLEGFSVGLGQNAPEHERERSDGQRTASSAATPAVPAAVAMHVPEPAVAAASGLNLRV